MEIDCDQHMILLQQCTFSGVHWNIIYNFAANITREGWLLDCMYRIRASSGITLVRQTLMKPI